MNDESLRFDFPQWGAARLYAHHGLRDAHRVLWGAQRPVDGIATSLKGPDLPHSESVWVPGGPPKPLARQTRAELDGREIFANWPQGLLGIRWAGGTESPPPRCFVLGKIRTDIWIADVVPYYENDLIGIALGWDADRIDPFSCSILYRSEHDGTPLLASQWKISDLPGEMVADDAGREARELAWNERTINVVLPRGPRRTNWGMTLLGPDGSIYDEMPVAPRVERIEMNMTISGSKGPAYTSVIGDRRPQPTEDELNEAVHAARDIESETRTRAARRRLSTAGELRTYIRWRFSARAGELLVLDRYLLRGKTEEEVEPIVEFLAGFNRPIRALVTKPSAIAAKLLATRPEIEARKTEANNFHDRLWIVGDSGLLVGASPNNFLRKQTATTAVDLPHADTAAWREKFDRWWVEAAVCM